MRVSFWRKTAVLNLTIIGCFVSSLLYAASCSVSSTPVAFGNYNPFSASHLDSTGTVTVSCTPDNTTYTISLESGLMGSITNRRMRGNSNNEQLRYNLYTDASRSIIWGNGTASTQSITANNNMPKTVYGRIPAGQNVGVGQYSDTVNITIEF